MSNYFHLENQNLIWVSAFFNSASREAVIRFQFVVLNIEDTVHNTSYLSINSIHSGEGWVRTNDIHINSVALYRLSYFPLCVERLY